MKSRSSKLGTSLSQPPEFRNRRFARSIAASPARCRPRPNTWHIQEPDPTITRAMIRRVHLLQTTYYWNGPNKGKRFLSFRGATVLRRLLALQARGGAIIEPVRATAARTHMSPSTVTREYRDWRAIGLLHETKIRSRGRSERTGNWKGSYGAKRHLDSDHSFMWILREEIDPMLQAVQTIENELVTEQCDIHTYGQNDRMPLRGSTYFGIYETPLLIANSAAESPAAPTQTHAEMENQEKPTQTPLAARFGEQFAYWKIKCSQEQMALLCSMANAWPGMDAAERERRVCQALTKLLLWTVKAGLPRIGNAALVLKQLAPMREQEAKLLATRTAERAKRRERERSAAAVARADEARKSEECRRPTQVVKNEHVNGSRCSSKSIPIKRASAADLAALIPPAPPGDAWNNHGYTRSEWRPMNDRES